MLQVFLCAQLEAAEKRRSMHFPGGGGEVPLLQLLEEADAENVLARLGDPSPPWLARLQMLDLICALHSGVRKTGRRAKIACSVASRPHLETEFCALCPTPAPAGKLSLGTSPTWGEPIRTWHTLCSGKGCTSVAAVCTVWWAVTRLTD